MKKLNNIIGNMKIFKTAIALLLLLGGLTVDVAAQVPVLTLQQALERAKENYPAIKAAQLEIERQDALKSTAIDLGTTSVYTGKEEIGNEAPGINNQIGINQSEIDILGIVSKNKLAKSRSQKAISGLDLTEAMVAKNIRIAWYRAVYAKEQWLLYQQLDSLYANFQKAAELRYKTQQTSKIEYLSATTKYQELMIEIKTAESNYRAALQILNQYLLFDGDFEIENAGSDLYSVSELTDSLNRSPELKYYSSMIDVSMAEWKAEKAVFLPKFDVGYVKQAIDGNSGYHGWQVGVSMPLLFFSQSGKTKASKINYQIASKQFEQKRVEVNTEYRQLLSRYIIMSDVIDYYNDKALQLADEQIEASNLAYRLGSIDYVQFIQNIESAIKIKQEYLIKKTENYELSAQLKYITGK